MGCYLITAGAGFIGSALAHRLIDNNIGLGIKTTVKDSINQLLISIDLTKNYLVEELNGSVNDVFR